MKIDQAVDTDFSLRIPSVNVIDRQHVDEGVAFWQVAGSSRFFLSNQQIELSANDVLWLPMGTRHSVRVQADSILLPFWFEYRLTATVLSDITVVQITDREKICFLALHQSYTTTLIRPQANVERQVLSILERRILGGGALPLPSTPAALTVANALLFNPGDDRLIARWASEVHLSSRSLERTFLAETGYTLREWRRRNRLQAAARLLKTGANVTAVSHRVGYESPNSFSRAFSNFFGIAPSRYAAEAVTPLTEIGNNAALGKGLPHANRSAGD